MQLTVKDAIELCKKSICEADCPIKDICDATVYDKATLEEQYVMMSHEEDMQVKDVVALEIKEYESRLEALRALKL